MSRPSSSGHKSTNSSSRPSRRKQAENWDDDFEFALPKSRTSRNDEGRASPAESWSESWDEDEASPPARRPAAGPHVPASAPPPLPLSYSALGLGAYPQPPAAPQAQRSRSGSTNTSTITRKLMKRHPSTSFIPVSTTTASQTSLTVHPHVNRSQPHLPRSDSSQKMPPPALPTVVGLIRTKSRSRARAVSKTDVRVSGIPFSPGQTEDKKPGFWKRLSGAPQPANGTAPAETRRRRASSVGVGLGPELPASHPEPLPPLPPNLRSPRSASTSTSASTSSNRSGPTPALTSILRRSSSSLNKNPPSAYPHPSASRTPSSTSLAANTSPSPIPPSNRYDALPPLTTSHSFSRGFHLPSPTPGSPYHGPRIQSPWYPGDGTTPPLPSSSSFPSRLIASHSGSDTETEPENPNTAEATPKRRKKIRPVSALPAARIPSSSSSIGKAIGWNGDPSWKGFATERISPRRPTAALEGLPSATLDSLTPSRTQTQTQTQSQTKDGTFATLKRIGSMSKKHGRKISNGWKFGTASSSSSNESKKLETVLASPTKSGRSKQADGKDTDEIKPGSISAPSSGFMELDGGSGSRRRKSWNDFVIPKELLDKQKELKENMSSVKQFAGGLSSLKDLIEVHDAISREICAHGSKSDALRLSALETEYEQWWEMATVLIEVGNTGMDTPSSASHAPPRPSRSRHVSLAGQPLAPSSSSSIQETPRNLSFTEGPPRASPPAPDKWRASTGRQDLSKKQLEILRNMLATPRPGMTRTLSTLSAASVANPSILSDSPASFSSFIVPSNSYPSPPLPQPNKEVRPILKNRRSSKAGLAGLKEFLRSLKRPTAGATLMPVSQSTSNPPSSRPAKKAPPPPLQIVPASASNIHPRPPPPHSRVKSPTTPKFDEVFYPTSKSTSAFSALPPQPQNPKRPGLRNIFRTSSGNWSELVRPPSRNGIDEPPLPSPYPQLVAVTKSPKRMKKSYTLSKEFGDKEPGPKMADMETVRPNRRSRLAEKDAAKKEDGSDGEEADVTESEVVVALTPENLPVLLDYLRQCQARLGEWKERIEREVEVEIGVRDGRAMGASVV
ncbi:hypothetical protein P7C73_g2081, partial [Tremellales sp. Uapishka_1]